MGLEELKKELFETRLAIEHLSIDDRQDPYHPLQKKHREIKKKIAHCLYLQLQEENKNDKHKRK